MKNFILKVLYIILIISGIGIVIWLIGGMGKLAIDGVNNVLVIVFYILGGGVISILIYFALRHVTSTSVENDASKMLEENIYNEIQKEIDKKDRP